MVKQFTNGYALLIGVNENINPTWALPDVEKDVKAIQNVLIHPERCAYIPDNVKVILGKDSTRQNILGGLTWLKKKINDDASENATAVVYYSGHGHRDDSQSPQYYLIPYDVDADAFKSSALRAEDFADAINALKPQRLFVLLDCCRSGGMGVKGVSTFRQSAVPPQIFITDAKTISPQNGAKGLEVLTRGSGRAVLSSSQGVQYSYLRKDRLMSIFTYHLIEALTGHAQPVAGAKEVLVSDVMSYVWRKVPGSAKTDWGEVQEPDYQVSGNFPIALLLGGKGSTKGLPAPDPLAPLTTERAISVTTINSGGGTVIQGNINVNNGGFVGGNRIVYGNEVKGNYIAGNVIKTGNISGQGIAVGPHSHASVTIGIPVKELQKLFEPLILSIRENQIGDKTEAMQKAEELKQEVAKGKDSNDSRIGKLIEGLIGLVPSAVGSIVSIFASPILGGISGPVTKFVLDKIKGD